MEVGMTIRAYRSSDLDEILTLFYDTVHTVNAKDYTSAQLDAWADGRADREAWNGIVQTYFTPEMAADWNANNAYWAELSSPVEETAEQVYDSFLKGNDQELGIRSYGACVDLLVAYFGNNA